MTGGCPLCGAAHSACGQPSGVVPIDERIEVLTVSGPLKVYEVVTGHGVRTRMKLNEQDAVRLGAVEVTRRAPESVEDKMRRTSANKVRSPRGARQSGDVPDGE